MSGEPVIRAALVTGGTGSIGGGVVRSLTAANLQVAFSGRSEERGTALEAATGARFLAADAADRDACDRCFSRAVDHLGRIDLFVSCTGIVFVSPLEDTELAVFREVVEVNLTSVFRYSRAAFQHMKSHGGGSIVHVVSDAALRGLHHIPAYSTAKAGLLAVSELLAAEGAPHGIRVNAICPGATRPGVQATLKGFEHHAENASSWGPALSGRHGEPGDIAKAVLWLASHDACHVSGATVRIDGAAGVAMWGRAHA
jgi:NAD(P)-dependent dehydrogenase (short-subunit alcohol dehydrogenase family)